MYRIEVINILGVKALYPRFKTYEKAKEYAEEYASNHCSCLNIEVVEYNPSEVVDKIISKNPKLNWLKEMI